MEQQPANEEHQAARLSGLRPQHPPVWQLVLDNICQSREEAEHLPSPLPQTPPNHQVAIQGDKHRGPAGCRHLQPVLTAQPKATQVLMWLLIHAARPELHLDTELKSLHCRGCLSIRLSPEDLSFWAVQIFACTGLIMAIN